MSCRPELSFSSPSALSSSTCSTQQRKLLWRWQSFLGISHLFLVAQKMIILPSTWKFSSSTLAKPLPLSATDIYWGYFSCWYGKWEWSSKKRHPCTIFLFLVFFILILFNYNIYCSKYRHMTMHYAIRAVIFEGGVFHRQNGLKIFVFINATIFAL